jgi:hypothetical protein
MSESSSSEEEEQARDRKRPAIQQHCIKVKRARKAQEEDIPNTDLLDLVMRVRRLVAGLETRLTGSSCASRANLQTTGPNLLPIR